MTRLKRVKKNKSGKQFVNFHCHSDYSVKDGACTINDIVDVLEQKNIPGSALTDHGTLSGWLRFYKMMRERGLKPILGCECYVDRRHEFQDVDKKQLRGRLWYHLTVIAKNNTGMMNLMKMNGEAVRDNFHYKPMITNEMLFKHKEGLVILSGCLSSQLSKLLIGDERYGIKPNEEEAFELMKKFQQEFGEDYFAEIHFNELNIQLELDKQIVRFARELNIPIISTIDSHYARRADVSLHDIKKLIEFTDMTKAEADRLAESDNMDDARRLPYFTTRELYIKTYDEMLDSAKRWNYTNALGEDTVVESLDNSMVLFDRCNTDFDTSIKFPKWKDDMTNEEVNKKLRDICKDKFNEALKTKKIPGKRWKQYKQRMERELDVIIGKNFSDYFLIISDILEWTRDNGIFYGGGRGSAAGSLVSYILGITKIDPIKQGLFFERFLNEQRNDPPDIDLDFESDFRDQVQNYIREYYGEKRVANIITFGKYSPKGTMRALGKVYEKNVYVVNRIAKGLDDNEKDFWSAIDEFEKTHFDDKQAIRFINASENQEYLDHCAKMIGQVSHYGKHAGGIVITPGEMEEYIPISKVNGVITTGFQEGGNVREMSDLGLLKIDCLGLTNVSIIHNTIRLINQFEGKDLSEEIFNINLDDDNLYKLLRDGDSIGVFQLEGDGITSFTLDVQPDRFSDVVAINALYRPATMKSGQTARFAKNKHNPDKIKLIHHAMEPILEETYGVIAYQEQMMNVFNQIGGMSLVRCDAGRKIIKYIGFAHSSEEDEQKYRDFIDEFSKGCKEKWNMDDDTIDNLVKTMSAFADYSFNKSHSVSYSFCSAQCLFLKYYYTLYFYCSLLKYCENSVKKVRGREWNELEKYMLQIKRKNVDNTDPSKGLIKILPPDVNESRHYFYPVFNEEYQHGAIRMGLSALKGVGDKAAEFLSEMHFESVLDFFTAEGMDWRILSKRVVEPLIYMGAFDNLCSFKDDDGDEYDLTRKELAKVYEYWLKDKNAKGSNKIKRYEMFIHYCNRVFREFEENETDRNFKISQLRTFEEKYLGFNYFENPDEDYAHLVQRNSAMDTVQIWNTQYGHSARFIGRVVRIRHHITKTDRKMAFITLKDSHGMLDITLWENFIEAHEDILVENNVLALTVSRNRKPKDESAKFYDGFTIGAKGTSVEDSIVFVKR